jgi:hypothetical protein
MTVSNVRYWACIRLSIKPIVLLVLVPIHSHETDGTGGTFSFLLVLDVTQTLYIHAIIVGGLALLSVLLHLLCNNAILLCIYYRLLLCVGTLLLTTTAFSPHPTQKK